MPKKNQAEYLYAQPLAATLAAGAGDDLQIDRGTAFHQTFAVARLRGRGTHRLQYYTGRGEKASQWWDVIPEHAGKAFNYEEAEVMLEEALQRAALSDTLMIVAVQARVLKTAHRRRIKQAVMEED